ncbi:MAG: FtsH protease activity modulator HflK [Gammaproteobacteria bacterium]
MAWNEKGDNGPKGKNPWEGKNEGPPDLEDAIRNFQRKLSGVFGGGGRGRPTDLKPQAPKSFLGIGFIALIVVIIYVISGVYLVQPAERAVVTRFGQYVRTEEPGPHWLPRFIEAKTVVNVEEVKTTRHGGEMLTMDENIVIAEIAVQYRVGNAHDYLFNVVEPERTLQKVSESAIRAVVGKSTLDEVIALGRAQVRSEIQEQVVSILSKYNIGIEITDLVLQQTKAPEQVKAAFDDATKAQQDEERLVNQAEAYARKIIPIAEGSAKRVREEANAYKEKVVLLAQGEASRFSKLLPEYRLAPDILRDRMYLSTMESVLSKSNKIIVDMEGGNNLVYLPIDKMMNQGQKPLQKVQVNIDEELEAQGENENNAAATGYRSERPSYLDAERSRPVRGG